jgi:hypothetical protein
MFWACTTAERAHRGRGAACTPQARGRAQPSSCAAVSRSRMSGCVGVAGLDGEDLPHEPRNAADQLVLPGSHPARPRRVLSVCPYGAGTKDWPPLLDAGRRLELDGQRWLVAGYGPASWAANARAAGEVTLSRGGRSQRFAVEETAPTAAVPVLRRYITEIRVTRPYFDVSPSSTDEEVAAELPRHPVFRLNPR